MKSRLKNMWKLAGVQGLVWAALLMGTTMQGQVSTQVTTTTVQGTVYQANGSPAQGTLLISWPAFETANSQAVAAGSLTVTIGADGFASVNLTPNQGADPAGSYYTVVYHLTGQTVSKEYWTVPAAASATIAAVRAQVEPATVAVQTVSKAYVDNLVATMTPTAANYLPLVGGALTGPLALPADPASSGQASTKHYVDAQVATALPLSGGVVTGTLAAANAIAKLPRVDVRSTDFAGGADPTGKRDSTAAFQAAIAFAQASSPSGETDYPEIYIPDGHYLINGTLRITNGMKMEGDGRGSTFLQETNATASLITVTNEPYCSTVACYGGLEHLTLEGEGKLTTGSLLELDAGYFVMRDLHFVNTGGRGLQMNAASERVSGYDLSFYYLRWPMIMAGDSNEDYFFNTHVLGAGVTEDRVSNLPYISNYCYSVNCTNGVYPAQGTTAAPTTIYPDPHGSIDIDKAVNVSFVGGSVKGTYILSGVKIWAGGVLRFQNFYHEDSYYGGAPAINRAYIVGGKGEQTYLTGVLSGTGLTVSVNDASWMPQAFGQASDGAANDGDAYRYLVLPQDYNRASSAPSAYVSGLNQNQYELVSIEGFTPDGVLHIQPGGRHAGGTAPAGTQWPAGSVIEEYSSGGAEVELDSVHLNQVQGPLTGNGWTAGCNQTNTNACGEVVLGYMPDIQNLTATPATNQTGFYAQLGDPNDPLNAATGYMEIRDMDMFNSPSNPYTGTIVGEHRADLAIDGTQDQEWIESQTATAATAAGEQVSLANMTGGGSIMAPLYSSGTLADVRVTAPGSGQEWDSYHGIFHKQSSVFGPYTQWGNYMNGLQYQNQYCMFDSPTTDGGRVQNRFCLGGGPNNTTNNSRGFGGGIEYDSWNGGDWIDLFKVYGLNGTGTLYAGVPATFGSSVGVSGTETVAGTLTASGASIVGGTLTASQVNGTITVDGTTYKTLNAAWTAAAAQATSSGRNQTIWLGPGNYPVTATMNEPVNGACVSVIGSAGTTTGSDVSSTATTVTITAALSGDVFFLGNAVLTEGCTFKDLNILAGKNATHGFEMQWARGLLLDTVTVNDTTAEGVLLGEETTTSGHQTNVLLRNVTVSYGSGAFAPSARPQWGVHLQKTAIDSVLHTITVRNALNAAVWNEGTGNLGYAVHGFGYPYTCTTGPCSNTATSGTAANASYASNYVVYDTGGAGSTWTDTYADSPAISAFYVGANAVEIRGGHVQWPELTSFPTANFATVATTVTNNLLIADVSCLGMSSSVNWINYASASGVPPTFASVHHLTGCGNYYQALEPATTTGFSGGGASNNAPGNGAVAAVWAAPKAGASTYSAYSAQEYTGYQGDLFDGHIAGQMPFFNITYQGTIKSQGGLALSTVINTASTLSLTTANKNVIANAASGAQTITLPSCYTAMPDKSAPTGLELTVVKSDTSANAVTLMTLSGQTINYQGVVAATLVVGSAGKRSLVCGPDNNWYAY